MGSQLDERVRAWLRGGARYACIEFSTWMSSSVVRSQNGAA